MIGLQYILGLYNMQYIELAEKLGIKKQNINLWIKGKQNIPKKYLPVLEELFSVKGEYFSKELTEIEKLEIQKEKLKRELNPAIERYEKQLHGDNLEGLVSVPIYDKEEINSIEKTIEKTKLVKRVKETLDIYSEPPYTDTVKLMVELMEKAQHEPILHKTVEALAHYFSLLPEDVSRGEEQLGFEEEIFEVFDDNNF